MAKNNDGDGGSQDNLTPLQRYLAKQKADGGSSLPPKIEKAGGESAPSFASRFRTTFTPSATPTQPPTQPPTQASKASSGVSSAPEPPGSNLPPRAEDSAPQAPPTDSAPFWKAKETRETAAANPPRATTSLTRPAPFFPRAIAYFVDLFLVSKVAGVLTFSSTTGFYFGSHLTEWLYSPFQFFVLQVVTFVYFGWFYREKGATPGKMLMGLEISTDASLGGDERLSFVRTYLRESIGKIISASLLFMGYFLALFRDDHRALHDLLFETRVVKRVKVSSST